MFEGIVVGLGQMGSLTNLLFMNVGLLIGIIFGAIPGLTVLLAIVLFLPLTFGLSDTTGILMLIGIYCGGSYGGSISAILINTPGTPNAAATVIDGYALAKKGRAKSALMVALYASVFGGVVSAIVLLFAAPPIAKVTRFFGPAEYFTLAVFGISMIAGVSGKNMLKGIMAGCLGILISMVGQDATTGVFRFSFDIIDLAAGVEFVPVLIGLFAISELLAKTSDHKKLHTMSSAVRMDHNDHLHIKEFLSVWKTIVRSTFIGIVIGAIPGTGGGIASFLSYNEAKRKSKHPEEFGNGSIEGIAAAETANNAVTGGALIPTMTLGVPGEAVTAVMLGALMMNGLIPGSRIFIEHRDVMYTILIGTVFINLFMLVQGKALIRVFSLITKIPDSLLMPILFALCVAGAYAVSNSVFNVFIMFIFGGLAFAMHYFGYPVVPLLLGIILGPMAESNLKRALVISDGSPLIFITRPISVVFILLTVLSVYASIRSSMVKKQED